MLKLILFWLQLSIRRLCYLNMKFRLRQGLKCTRASSKIPLC